MTLSEHIKKEQLEELISAWPHLNWFQRKIIRLRIFMIVLPHKAGNAILKRLDNQRARYVYWYPAHWVR